MHCERDHHSTAVSSLLRTPWVSAALLKSSLVQKYEKIEVVVIDTRRMSTSENRLSEGFPQLVLPAIADRPTKLIAAILSERGESESPDSKASSREAFFEAERIALILKDLEECDREEQSAQEEHLRQEAGERENQRRLLRQLELDLEVEQVSGQRKRVRATSPVLESASESTGA